ncbi:hypothetical protein GSI_10569 [Ganoderma sinense ZZ0214-1]|uniref:Probable RNA-binding protein 18 n=1 Tax=Ganoderma sinense ZZ0214-1 TaxID=1077348 RepID=A0A2G8S0Y2_9APHY|nr:hypothetical protein GSI_10569 [Ganoderma sinense ZZ0214-1]
MATTPQDLSPAVASPERTPPRTASLSAALEDHLSYPAASEPIAPPTSSSSSVAQLRPLLKDRLYVGNLHPSVDEYSLLQAFSKFGKISKLDYLFHKSGPLKGKPRGYAFVEFSNKEDADKALSHANNKLLRGRKLVVTYANQAPLDSASGLPGAGMKYRRAISDVGKPTTLSLLKSAGTGRSDATDAKIARMEAKLRQLEGASSALTSGSGTGASTSASAASTVSSLFAHPSLPPKPIAAIAALDAAARQAPTTSSAMAAASRSRASGGVREKSRQAAPSLPSLPIVPPTQSVKRLEKSSQSAASASTNAKGLPNKKGVLSGVRIVKTKNTSSAG